MSRRQDIILARLRLIATRWHRPDPVSVAGPTRRLGPQAAEVAEAGGLAATGAGAGTVRAAGGAASLDPDGLEADGLDPDGLDPGGLDPDGPDRGGLGPEGFDPGGPDPDGQGDDALDQDAPDSERLDPERLDPDERDPAGGDPIGRTPDVADPLGPLPRTSLRAWLVLLSVLAVVVGTLCAVALLRAWPVPRAQVAGVAPIVTAGSPSADVSGVDPPMTVPAASSPSPARASLVVHVVGQVKHPGVVVLPAGSRVADALVAAGGLRRGGSVGATNLARLLGDGERIEIGAVTDPGGADPGTAAGAGTSGPIDLNSATADQLDSLPGIGPVTAAKILAWRSAHGRFSVVDELAEVPGIGPKTLEELRAHVRV